MVKSCSGGHFFLGGGGGFQNYALLIFVYSKHQTIQ